MIYIRIVYIFDSTQKKDSKFHKTGSERNQPPTIIIKRTAASRMRGIGKYEKPPSQHIKTQQGNIFVSKCERGWLTVNYGFNSIYKATVYIYIYIFHAFSHPFSLIFSFNVYFERSGEYGVWNEWKAFHIQSELLYMCFSIIVYMFLCVWNYPIAQTHRMSWKTSPYTNTNGKRTIN